MPGPQTRNKYLGLVLDACPALSKITELLCLNMNGPIPVIHYGPGALTTVEFYQLKARVMPTRKAMLNPYESKVSIPRIEWQGERVPKKLKTYSLGYPWDERMMDSDGFYPVNERVARGAETRLDVFTAFDLDLADFFGDLSNWDAAYKLDNSVSGHYWDDPDIDPLTDRQTGMARVFLIMRLLNAPITDIMIDSVAYAALTTNPHTGQRCSGQGNAGSPPIPTMDQLESQLMLLNARRPVKVHIYDLGISETPLKPGAKDGTFTYKNYNSVTYLSNGSIAKTLSDTPPAMDGTMAVLPQIAAPFVGVFGNEIIEERNRGDSWSAGEDISVNGGFVTISTKLSFRQTNAAEVPLNE